MIRSTYGLTGMTSAGLNSTYSMSTVGLNSTYGLTGMTSAGLYSTYDVTSAGFYSTSSDTIQLIAAI